MVAAMSSVKNGMYIKEAAEQHGVPTTTLRDRINGRVIHGNNPGPRPYLSMSEERELSTFLKNCSSVGYGKTSKYLIPQATATPVSKSVPRARLLTSFEAIAQVEEKERKKKLIEERERRKAERERKKCQKKKEQERKAEERKIRAAKKAKEADDKR